MSEYEDPHDIDELRSRINEMKSLGSISDTINFINNYLPGWIVGILSEYSQDYPHLITNWQYLCREMKTEPKKILLVDKIIYDPDNTLLIHLCEFITKNGYVVRRKEEFIACDRCGKVLPSQGLYEYMKTKIPNNVPERWSNKCSTC